VAVGPASPEGPAVDVRVAAIQAEDVRAEDMRVAVTRAAVAVITKKPTAAALSVLRPFSVAG
jgi:hypothetical protein